MSQNSYFAQYQSPNIIIVPTLSFSPPSTSPGTEKVDHALNNSLINCEQITAKDSNEPSPSGSNCNQQNLKVVVNTNSSTQAIERANTSGSSYFRNSLFKIQDTISTEAPSNSMSQGIKELSSSKYKSRNNLVDLTGFNMLKRDSASSLTKHKDSRWNDNTKIEQDKKTSDEKEHRDCSDNDTDKTDNISKHIFEDKESSKGVKPTSSHYEGSANDHTNSESKKNTIDMEDKMKKYFRHLWKRNIEKLKDKSTQEKPDKDLKSTSKIKQNSKNSKPEFSRSKANLQRISKNNTKKYLKNKIIEDSKKYHDLERKFIAEYSKRSKIETNTRLLKDSKEFISDREANLSPVSNKRYKDFQHFISRHNDDHENKYKTGNRSETENLSDKKIRKKSCETTTNKKDLKKKIDIIRKQPIKIEKNSKGNTNQTNMEMVANQTNTEKFKLIKSVVRINKNPPNNQQSKCVNGGHDLRSRLSRKRTKSDCFAHSQQSVVNKRNRENLVITVKQDVKADPKNSATSTPKENKPKTKKCKKIKLIINIECTNSDSDDTDQNLNECCSSPQDLSFLDDFNVDEIVDSLNNSHSQVEHNKTITTDNTKPQVLNKINENINKNKCNEETKSKEGLINDINMKPIQIKKEETGLHKDQVIVINSDTEDEDLNLEIGSVANTKACKNEQIMKSNSKIDRIIMQETKNITKNPCEENAQEETMDLCNDSNDSVQEIDITDKNKHYKSSKHWHLILAGDMKRPETNKGVSNVDRIFELLTRSNKPSVKRLSTESAIKKPRNTVNINDGKKTRVLFRKHENTNQTPLTTVENAFEIKVENKSESSKKTEIYLQKSEDPIEASLETMFNHIEQNNIGMRRDKIEQINSLDKHFKKQNVNSQNHKDTVETSLKTMLKTIERNGRTHKHIEPSNGSDKKSKKENLNLQNSGDALEASLEIIFNDTKQEAGNNIDIKQPNSTIQHIKRGTHGLQTAQKSIKLPLKIMSNRVDQKANNKKTDIELSNEAHKHIKTEYSQKNVGQILPVIMQNSKERKANIKINTEPSHVSNKQIKENLLHKYGSISKRNLDTQENMLEKKANNKMDVIPPCRSYEKFKENKEHLRTFEDTNKPLVKSINNIEKKTHNIIHSQPSNKYIKDKLDTLEPVKSLVDQKVASQIYIRPQSSVSQNNKTKRGEIVKNLVQQKAASRMDIRSQNIVSQNNKGEEIVKEVVQQKAASRMDIRPQSIVSQNNKEEETVLDVVQQEAASQIDISPQSIGSQNKKGEEIVKDVVQQKVASRMDIRPQSIVSQNNKEETVQDVVQQKAASQMDIRPQSIVSQNNKEETVKDVQQKAASRMAIRPQSSVSHNNDAKGEESVKSFVQPQAASGMDTRPQSSVIQNKVREETMNSFAQQNAASGMDIRPQSSVSENNKANGEGTVKSFVQQKAASRIDTTPQSSVIQNKLKEEETMKSFTQQNAASGLDIRPQSSVSQNNKAKGEEIVKSSVQQKVRSQSSGSQNNKAEGKHLQKSKGTIKTSLESIIDNVEQKTSVKSESNISSKNIEVKKSLPIQNSEVISEKSSETDNDNIQHKTNVTTNVGSLTNTDKNTEDTSEKTCKATTEKSLLPNNKELIISGKSNVEENQAKSLETVKHITPKPETMDDDVPKTKDTNKDSELDKGAEMATNSKKEQVDSSNNIIPGGRENTDVTELKHVIKSNKVELKSLQKTAPFLLAKLEARMLDYLDKKYTVTSVIFNGRFSSIYKCKDNEGETYAVKVVNVRSKGILMEGMLFQLQKYRSRVDSCVLYLLNAFEVNGRWCLLTEYYPKNLEQALHENMRSFHIDLVQVLSRQLVDAVNMLTNYKIIHSDIKPAHILLNSAHDRLKVCGFDRSNYSSCIKIIPSTGSPNYRAPEVILGFSEDHRIDVWSTAVVMFEMSTNKKLFPGHYNNEILFQQLCTLGSFDWSMVEQSRFKHLYFTGTSFIRKVGSNGQKIVLVHSFHRNKILRKQLFVSYQHDWARSRTRWEMTTDMDKLETLHSLLEQMLTLDPRHRLPIQFVGASEFIHDTFA